MKEPPKKMVIDRARWARRMADGSRPLWNRDETGTFRTALLTEAGGMCCLGFYCEQILGVPSDRLRNVGLPSHLEEGLAVNSSLGFWARFAELNDRDDGLFNVAAHFGSDAKQEEDIASLFLEKLDVEVEFIN